MDSGSGNTPGSRPSVLEAGRQDSNQSYGRESQTDGAGSGHITIPEPQRPSLPKRNTLRGESTKSISEALRLARTREEQETLLGDEELADDDGCYPPRQSDAPRVPNPHRTLPIYTTIHKIRRLIYASIGRHAREKHHDPFSTKGRRNWVLILYVVYRRSVFERTAQKSPHERGCHSPPCGSHLRPR